MSWWMNSLKIITRHFSYFTLSKTHLLFNHFVIQAPKSTRGPRCTFSASQGAASVNVDAVGPQLSDDIGGCYGIWWGAASASIFLGVLPQVLHSSPWVLRHRGSGGVWTAPAGLSQLFAPAYRVEVGGGWSKVRMCNTPCYTLPNLYHWCLNHALNPLVNQILLKLKEIQM
jgi:hypothetical protein